MLTDRAPSTAAIRARFLESDRLTALEVPQDDRLPASSHPIASAMRGGTASSVRRACAEFLSVPSGFYLVRQPGIRVLAARPLRVREGGSAIELFGDYHPETLLIRLWMRTAIRKQSPRSARSSALSAMSSAITSTASVSVGASRSIHGAFTGALLRSTTTHAALR